MRSWRDPLRTPTRVVVAGVSGVGRSTLARRISEALDLPSPVALFRVVRRTFIRSRRRIELWSGNTEPGMWHALADREGIIRWALRHVAGEELFSLGGARPRARRSPRRSAGFAARTARSPPRVAPG